MRRTVVVFTEGKNSEPDYVKGLMALPEVSSNTALSLQIHPDHGVPLTLVRMASDRLAEAEVDECWCLFDVEWPKNHPNLIEARDLARRNGVKLAISNPCFEIWLILHHRPHTKFGNTGEIESLSRRFDGREGKTISAEEYMPARKEAAARAVALDRRHEGDGTPFPHNNPSSGMHLFLRSIEPTDQRSKASI
ncbi:RloB family protein [Agromyces sp. CCNWLW203]|uniref:RloB family protein n=1 Tax=Agromyces sp. CCNWLW203 TaxID=3112842 RepID=UPI003FA5B3FF